MSAEMSQIRGQEFTTEGTQALKSVPKKKTLEIDENNAFKGFEKTRWGSRI